MRKNACRLKKPDQIDLREVRLLARDPDVIALRREEDYADRLTTETQRLSRDLAARYGRDIFSDFGLASGQFSVMMHDGSCSRRMGDPNEAFLRKGKWRAIAVARDVAHRLLDRART